MVTDGPVIPQSSDSHSVHEASGQPFDGLPRGGPVGADRSGRSDRGDMKEEPMAIACHCNTWAGF